MDELLDVTVCDGKYRVIQDRNGKVNVLRHGEAWQDVSGDNLILALAQEVESLRAAAKADKPVLKLVGRTDLADDLLVKLDKKALEADPQHYGLPTEKMDYLFAMRVIIVEWIQGLNL